MEKEAQQAISIRERRRSSSSCEQKIIIQSDRLLSSAYNKNQGAEPFRF
jgi:hypothetical protein